MTIKRSQNRSARYRRNAAKSYTGIGYASILLAFSSVHAFTTISRPGRQRLQQEFSRYSPGDVPSLEPSVISTSQPSRQYRARPSTRRFASTRLHYRGGDEEESAAQRQENARAIKKMAENEASGWWKSVFDGPGHAPAPTAFIEEQEVVDEYLEFLEKRYKWRHENENKKPEPFSALKWLTAADEKNDRVTAQEEEDALYVLGVAGLASERLLQKHQAALKQDYKHREPAHQEMPEVVIDAVAHDVSQDVVALAEPSAIRQALMIASLMQAGRKVMKSVGDRRNALIAYQNKKVIAALSAAVKTIARTPIKVTRMAWNLGGGKKAITLTVSAFFTAFLLVRPVAQALMKEISMSSS